MKRITFIKTSALAGLGLGFSGFKFHHLHGKTHILTLSFDDGFKKSFYRIADIHESYGLKACLNVIASGHLNSFKPKDKWIPPESLGNFDDWNILQDRGHEIMPHTWEHLNLTEIPIVKAKENIDKCLNYFEEHLEGFKSSESVYNFAYNASTPELEDYLFQRVRAIRTGGWLVLNGSKSNLLPVSPKPARLGCWGYGPDFCDDFVEEQVNDFLASSGGWLILNLHGLENEGWGPIRTSYLDNLLMRVTKIDYLAVMSYGEVLGQTKG